jgi:superfamily I DNA/RNA helicase
MDPKIRKGKIFQPINQLLEKRNIPPRISGNLFFWKEKNIKTPSQHSLLVLSNELRHGHSTHRVY